MKRRSVWASFLIATALVTNAQSTEQSAGQSAEQKPSAELEDLQVRIAPHKGDLDDMDQRRVVRALVTFNRASFFFDNGRPRGMTYDALTEFEKFLNRKLHPNDSTGKEKSHVVLVPTTIAKMASDLQNGNGDIIAAAVYITDSRKKMFDFVPLASSVRDVVVAGPDSPPLGSLEDLSGKEVYLFKEMLAWDKLESGWVVRKDSPKLRAMLEEFASTHREGSAYFAQLANTYLKSGRFIKNNQNAESAKRFSQMKSLFQKYANQYQFPWMLIAAEAYQESALNQDAKSPVGAIGVMQVMPKTAASPPVNIPDVTKVDANIQAGVKLLKYIRDDYFKNEPMDPLNKTLMTLAAYNAGPARIKQCRKLSQDMGLNPNIWFKNVEYAVAKKVGSETVNYVSNIYKYYLGWKLMTEREAARTQVKQTHVSSRLTTSKTSH